MAQFQNWPRDLRPASCHCGQMLSWEQALNGYEFFTDATGEARVTTCPRCERKLTINNIIQEAK
jgi:hypothetical protein